MVLFPHSQKLMSCIPVLDPHSDNFTDKTLPNFGWNIFQKSPFEMLTLDCEDDAACSAGHVLLNTPCKLILI